MFLTAIIIIVIMGMYVICNRGNKIIYTLPIYFFCIATMIVSAVLYLSKIEVYRFTTKADYNLYMLMQGIKVNVTDVSIVYNFSIAAFLMCSVIVVHFLIPNKYHFEFLLLIPIMGFLVWNAPSVTRSIYITSLTAAESNPTVKSLILACNFVNKYMMLFYIICPFYALFLYFTRTQIPTKRKMSVMLGLFILLIDIFVYINFIKGAFGPIWYSNVDASKLPSEHGGGDYTFTSIIILSMLVVLLLLTVYSNPFYSFKKVKKREMMHNARLISENTFMTLHMYKNAFFAVGQQLELIKLSCSRSDTKKTEQHADKGMEIVGGYMDMLNRMLELFKKNSGYYSVTNIIECVEEAYAKVSISQCIELKKLYKDKCINVLCNRLNMVELFVNLFRNAAEALSEKKDNPYIEISIINENDLCMINIKDNGCGIERKNLGKIFMPFYSSKPRSKSNGIGLSYVSKVIKQHHGEIIVKSEPGHYTVFSVVLQKHSKRRYTPNGQNKSSDMR